MADFLNLYKIDLVNLASGGASLNDVLTWNGTQWIPQAGGGGGGSGTVTSVGLSLPGIFSVSGSPVTISGTLTAALVSQAANQVWASPDGVAGAPTFRALVAADIPTIPASGVSGLAAIATSGSATDLIAGTVADARLASSYAAITSLPSLSAVDTITAGIWNATVIGTQFGGTGQNFSASSGYVKLAAGVAAANATIPLVDLAQDGAAPGQVLQWTGSAWEPGLDDSILFGSGRDGNVTFDGSSVALGITPTAGVYTINREIEARNVTITGATTTVVMSGYGLSCQGTLDISNATNPSGAIIFRPAANLNGGSTANNTAGTQASTVPTAGTLPVGLRGLAGAAGGTGVGGAGVAGTAGNTILVNGNGAAVLAGGNGTPNAGGAAAAGGAATGIFGAVNALFTLPIPRLFGNTGIFATVAGTSIGLTGPLNGARGGAGGGDGTNAGGGSGGSGSGGGTIVIRARVIQRGTLVNPGVIRAIGGNGGNSGTPAAGNAGGGAGSGGGQGGNVLVVCNYLLGSTIANAIDVTGGQGGSGGNGLGTGLGGGGGGAGPSGLALLWVTSAQTVTGTTIAAAVAGNAAAGATGGAVRAATVTRLNL